MVKGGTKNSSLYSNKKKIKKKYKTNQIYNTLLKTGIEPINYGIPFWVKNLTASPITFQITSDVDITSFDFEFEKSDDLSSWVSIGNMRTAASNPLTTTIPANGRVYFRALTKSYHAMQTYDRYCHISCSGSFEIGGNIMSLLKGSTFTGQETTLPSTQCFAKLFQTATTLVKADELLLPANTLTSSCYESMFVGCSALVYAPKLPATTLAVSCYSGMFNKCTSLTTAPEIFGTTPATLCFGNMFEGCTSLTYIKVHFTSLDVRFTRDWTKLTVNTTGTFVCPSDLIVSFNADGNNSSKTSLAGASNAVPYGWTVQKY